ncbi:MAG: cytidine deaminase [Candidatus Bathyarchaeales archaeon]
MASVGKEEKMLLEATAKALCNAYVLWGFKVGAAVLGEDGEIYDGCNVESWVSGLGICAERCAVNHAVLHGNRRIKAVALVMEKESSEDPKPCGACLQYISDFAEKPKIKIVTAKVENGEVLFETVKVKTLEELLPSPFKR